MADKELLDKKTLRRQAVAIYDAMQYSPLSGKLLPDLPADASEEHIRVIELRLLSGESREEVLNNLLQNAVALSKRQHRTPETRQNDSTTLSYGLLSFRQKAERILERNTVSAVTGNPLPALEGEAREKRLDEIELQLKERAAENSASVESDLVNKEKVAIKAQLEIITEGGEYSLYYQRTATEGYFQRLVLARTSDDKGVSGLFSETAHRVAVTDNMKQVVDLVHEAMEMHAVCSVYAGNVQGRPLAEVAATIENNELRNNTMEDVSIADVADNEAKEVKQLQGLLNREWLL